MKRILCIAVVIPLVMCCHGRRTCEPVPVDEPVPCNMLDSIFRVKVLQDTLNAFMTAVDSFPTSFTPNVVYTVCLERSGKDTLVRFWAGSYIGLLDAGRRLVGAVKHGNKVVALKYYQFDTLPDVVNEDIFDMDLYVKNTGPYFDIVVGIAGYEGDVFHRAQRHYRMVGRDSLQLEYIRKSCYELGPTTYNSRYKPGPERRPANFDCAFVSMPIKDSLLAFMSSVDSIPNPYSSDVVFTVQLKKEESDILVTFTANAYVQNEFSDSYLDEYRCMGAVKIGSKVVAVRGHYGKEKYEKFVNWRYLDEDIYAEHTIVYYDIMHNYADYDWRPVPIVRQYRLSADSMQLLSAQTGPPEDPYKERFLWRSEPIIIPIIEEDIEIDDDFQW